MTLLLFPGQDPKYGWL